MRLCPVVVLWCFCFSLRTTHYCHCLASSHSQHCLPLQLLATSSVPMDDLFELTPSMSSSSLKETLCQVIKPKGLSTLNLPCYCPRDRESHSGHRPCHIRPCDASTLLICLSLCPASPCLSLFSFSLLCATSSS